MRIFLSCVRLLNVTPLTSLSELYDFKSGDLSGVESQAYECPHLLPAVITGRSGIDVEQTEFMVGHDLEYVRMSAHHKPDPVFPHELFNPRSIASGISAYMCHEHTHSLNLKYLGLTATTAHISVIDIAPDGTNYGHYSFEPADNVNITNVTGMPYLIAVLEMGGVTVIPA